MRSGIKTRDDEEFLKRLAALLEFHECYCENLMQLTLHLIIKEIFSSFELKQIFNYKFYLQYTLGQRTIILLRDLSSI